jgi:hypothetical protein
MAAVATAACMLRTTTALQLRVYTVVYVERRGEYGKKTRCAKSGPNYGSRGPETSLE